MREFKKGDNVVYCWKGIITHGGGKVTYVEDRYRIYVKWEDDPKGYNSYTHNELMLIPEPNDILKGML